MLTLLRYWLVPGWLRRLPRAAWIAIAICYAASLCFMPRYVPQKNGFTFNTPIWNDVLQIDFLWIGSTISIFGLVAGSLTIVTGREKRTWEALALTRFTAQELLRGKLAAVWLQGLALFLPAVVFLVRSAVMWTYLEEVQPVPTIVVMNTFLMATLAIHLLTFSLIGMVISAFSRRTHLALSVAGSVIAAYCAIHQSVERLTSYWFTICDPNLHAHLLYWPSAPFAPFVCNETWPVSLIANAVWGVAVPVACWIFLRCSFRSMVRR